MCGVIGALFAFLCFLMGLGLVFEVLIGFSPIVGGLIFLFLAACVLKAMSDDPWEDSY